MHKPLFPEKIGRREALARIGSCVAGVAALPLFARAGWALDDPEPQQKPNLILIIMDDLGYGDISCFGCPDINTPNLDAIAAHGVKMTSFYVAAAVCSPTRVSALTGNTPYRTSCPGLPDSHDPNDGLSPDEVTIAEVLKTQGYATGLCGKWHLGYSPKLRARKQGFDEYIGELAGSSDCWTHLYGTDNILQKWMFRNDTPFDEPAYLTDLWTGEAKSFITRHKDHPFFLYIPYNAPHSPLSAPDGRVEETREIYKAMVERVDAGVGQIMQRLRDCGIEDNTLVVFFSDNGSDEGSQGDNGPLKGGKRTVYEGALRVPFVAQWPAKINPGVVSSEPIISMDVFRTFAAAAGAKVPPGAGVDSMNVLKVLQGQAATPHEYLCWRFNWDYAARRGDWKVVQDSTGNHLYNLSTDIGETTDLSSSQPAIRDELISRITEWSDTLARRASYIVTSE